MNRSSRFVFVPFCALAQAARAEGIVKVFPAIVKPLIDYLAAQKINIVQMPCPEFYFAGIKRKPCGKEKYDNRNNRDVCRTIAAKVVSDIDLIISGGYSIEAILGVNNSPTCAVDYIAGRGRSRISGTGIFLEELKDALQNRTPIPIVGIDIYKIDKTISALKTILEKKDTNGMQSN